jgi:hypothetical protein
MNTWNVFFLFPGRVCFGFYSLGSQQTKDPTGQKFLVCFGAIPVDTKFQPLVSMLFLKFLFQGTGGLFSVDVLCADCCLP